MKLEKSSNKIGKQLILMLFIILSCLFIKTNNIKAETTSVSMPTGKVFNTTLKKALDPNATDSSAYVLTDKYATKIVFTQTIPAQYDKILNNLSSYGIKIYVYGTNIYLYPNLPKKLYTCHIERVLKPA